MNRNKSTFILSMVVCLLAAASVPLPAHAWGSASGARGGSASWGGGSGSATDARGGSASWGGGSGSASSARGGSAEWSHGTGYAQGAGGGTAAWNHGGTYGAAAAYHPPAPAYGYHPPTAAYGYHPPVAYPVPVYGGGYSSSQVAGAAVAGMAVGAMVGASAAKSSAPPPSSTTVVVQESPGASQMPVGAQVTVLPGNCGSATVGDVEYYQCGPNWFKPYFGNSSVYYKVVQAPY